MVRALARRSPRPPLPPIRRSARSSARSPRRSSTMPTCVWRPGGARGLTNTGMLPPVDEGFRSLTAARRGRARAGVRGDAGGDRYEHVGGPREGRFPRAPDQDPRRTVHFVEAAAIASIHEHGVDLRIDPAAVRGLPGPEHKAPVFNEDAGDQGRWHHWVHRLSGMGTGTASTERGSAPAAFAARMPNRGMTWQPTQRGWRRSSRRATGAQEQPSRAGGALLPRARDAGGTRLHAAHPLPARPRQDRALQGVPPAEAQDPGVRGADGGPLPHAAHPHAGGHEDLAHGGARATPQRGSDGGDRAGPRPGAPPVRAHRRGGAGRLPARALRRGASATTSTPCGSWSAWSATGRA